jgi:peptide/nickel transport system substrate-binding protein
MLWHNGHSLTAGDVVFTFNAINDQQYKSPLRLSFVGVEASATDDLTVVFKLKEPYGGFINLLTFGILPAELWSNLTPSSVGLTELNLKPIGSGPYRFKSLIKDKNGNLKSFNLEANEDYFLGRPLVKDFSLQFFPSPEEAREALNTGSVDGFGSYASDLGENYETKTFINYYSLATPQVKALFFNTKLGKLSDIKLRQAIAYSLDKKAIVSAAVGKATQYIDGPILPYSQLYSDDFIKYQKDLAVAQKKIEEAGWKLVEVTANDLAKADELLASTDDKKKRAGESYKLLGEGSWYYKNGEYLILKLTTAEIGSNLKLADLVSQSLAEIKVKLVVEPVPANHLQGDVIKTRDYEMLLTGEILPADGDPYLYWHSSQSSGDGLNLSNFNDKELDRLIEDGRLTTDQTRRKIDYAKLSKLIADKVPVIYFYALNYSYAHGHQIKNFNGSVVYSASDRFGSIKNWYTETENNFKW